MSISDWELSAVHGLRKYMWQLLKDELEWNLDNYEVTRLDPISGAENKIKLVPIVTPEQQPEMNDLDWPYIVYSYAKKQSSNLYVLEGEIASFTIYSPRSNDITRALNMLEAKLDKRDQAGRELNDYIRATQDDRYKAFDYKTLWVSGMQGPQPVSEEGGRRDGLIVVNITYTHYGPDGTSIRR